MRGTLLWITALLAAATSLPASAEDTGDGWQFRLTPYIWLPTIDGALKHDVPPGAGGSPEISMGPTDWLDLLNAGLLVTGTATKGRFSLQSDLVYLSLTSKNDGRVLSVEDTVTVPGTRIPVPVSASLNLNTRTDLDGLMWSITGGYRFFESERSTSTGFIGARYFGADATSSWDLTAEVTVPGTGVILPSQGRVGSDVDLWDMLIGVRGESKLGDGNWSALYHLDIGTGDSDLTWNAYLGLTYRYGWGDLLMAYRHLEYDQASNKLLQDFSFSGPGIGARFRFD
jgi:hypothetical protein